QHSRCRPDDYSFHDLSSRYSEDSCGAGQPGKTAYLTMMNPERTVNTQKRAACISAVNTLATPRRRAAQSEAGKPNFSNDDMWNATTCEMPSGRTAITCIWSGSWTPVSRLMMYSAAAG